MIPIILCFLFGHKLRERMFNGKQYETTHHLTGQAVKGNYYEWHWNGICPRCGKKLR